MVNFDCSAFFIKRRKDLIDTYSITPSYLRNEFTESGLVTDYRDWQIPLGRRFRSLKVWFVLRSYGVKGLQAFIRKHIALSEYFAAQLKTRQDLFKVTTDAAFGLVTFQVKPKPLSPSGGAADRPDPRHEAWTSDFTPSGEGMWTEDCNAVTKRVYEKINSQGEFYISSSVVCGIYIIRIVSANTAAEEKYLQMVFERLVEAAEEERGGKA